MRICWKTFGGIIPRTASRNLPELMAQTAQNTWLAPTSLESIKEPLTIQAVAAGSESMYLWRRGGSSEWLTWTGDVDVRKGPIADDQYSRIYYTDGTTLHMKLWDGAKVEVDDVSIAAPAAPTITKTLWFDPSNVKMWHDGGNMSWPLSYRGMSLDGNIMKLRFYENPWNGTLQGLYNAFYYMQVTTGRADSDSGVIDTTRITIPTPTTYANQELLYSTISDLTFNSVKYGTFQVIGKEVKPTSDSNNVTMPGGGGWYTYYGADVEFSCRLDLNRSSVQYQYYVQTVVNKYGQESPPSVVSTQVEWNCNEKLTIHAVNGGVGTKTRIYRSATGLESSKFYFVAEVDPGATYVDNNTDAQLAETLPLIENPPTQMTGLVSVPGGYFAAFNGKDLYFSEPWLPYSWPTRYRLTLDFDIVGLAVSGNDVIALTTGNPYYITGTHPEILSQTKLAVEQSCVSKRSICYADKYVCFASPDGLCSVSGGNVQVISSRFYTRDQWQALTPADMIGAVHDQRFIGFISGGAIIFDFKEPNATLGTTDQQASGLYSDLENDQLYLIQGTNITDWRAGADYLTYIWKSKKFQNVQDAIFSSCKIISESYADLTFKMFADGVQVWSYTVTDAKGFRVPTLDRSAAWEVSLEGTDRVCEMILASNMTLLRSGDGIRNDDRRG